MRSKKNGKKSKSAIADTTMDIKADQEKMATNNKESNNGNCLNDEEGSIVAENVASNLEGNQRPKLDEGFFEIEAIRHKRVRKGELQYLIKWREYPETANTWEPLWNLQSCTYLINAFEESLLSSKQRKRKGMYKYGNTQSQSKKKKQLSSPTVIERKSGQTLVPSNGGIGSSGIASSVHEEKKADDVHSVKLDNLPKVAEQTGNENPANKDGNLDTNGAKPTASAHFKGSARRKPKSVKRFNKDPVPDQPDASGIQKQSTHDTENALTITEIIKPIRFAASVLNNDQEVDVRFMVKRSDGVEIMATNKYLKNHNPLMLIDFYERHLKYIPSIPLP